jgi:hypothetical protein
MCQTQMVPLSMLFTIVIARYRHHLSFLYTDIGWFMLFFVYSVLMFILRGAV